MAWMTGIALALSAAGAATQAVGTIKAGNAAKRAGEAQQRASDSQAELAEFNAEVAALQAEDALKRGTEEEQRFRSTIRGTIGAQRAGFAAGNIDVGYGSAVDVQADAATLGELDALTIRTNAAREAWGYKVAESDLRRRAEIARKEGVYLEAGGRAQQSASRWGAASGLVGTGGSLLAARYGWGRP